MKQPKKKEDVSSSPPKNSNSIVNTAAMKNQKDAKKNETDNIYEEPKENNLEGPQPNLSDRDINLAKTEITKDTTAKLIGLICHLAYWSVFGHINPLPLDKYHMKQLFISIA